MKYSQLRRGLSPEDAAAYVGSKELFATIGTSEMVETVRARKSAYAV
jgi:hypothetical protein